MVKGEKLSKLIFYWIKTQIIIIFYNKEFCRYINILLIFEELESLLQYDQYYLFGKILFKNI